MTDIILPLEESKHVKELLNILKANGMGEDAKGLIEVIGCVSSMERDLGKALSELTTMQLELSSMREEQNHPIKTMLHKAAEGLMARLKAIQKQLVALKDKIIGTCKEAVENIKDKGITAANDVVSFLNIKDDLQDARDSINNAISFNERKIANIEAASTEFHTTGRSIKNFSRALVGKNTIPDIKPNGKLAKLIQLPFNSEIKHLKRSLAHTNKALELIDKLEKSAELRSERERPSIHADMKRIGEEIRNIKPDTPKLDKNKASDQSL